MPVKRRKKVRKDVSIQIRATEEQRAMLAIEAEKNGLGLSTWLLTLGLQAIRAREK